MTIQMPSYNFALAVGPVADARSDPHGGQRDHYLAVFDDHTERPLYLGRQKRIATADQRLTCYARDHGLHPNCLEPGYHCEVHHSPDWADGGRTDADKLYFACGCHHGMASRGALRTEVTDSGQLR